MSGRLSDAAPRWATLAARVLGWPPDTFWRATPIELATALADPDAAASAAPSREQIARMMERDRHG